MAYADQVKKDQFTVVEAVQIKGPQNTYNLLSASSVIKLIVGTDLVTFGPHPNLALDDFGDVQSSMDPKAPSWTFNIIPFHPAIIEEFCDPAMQGSKVTYWSAIIEEKTGLVLDSRIMWRGMINTQIASIESGKPVIEIETVTISDFLMKPNEAERLTVAWQEEHFPGEKGLAHNDSAAKIPYWGIDVKSHSGSNGGNSGGGSWDFKAGDVIGNIIRQQQAK